MDQLFGNTQWKKRSGVFGGPLATIKSGKRIATKSGGTLSRFAEAASDPTFDGRVLWLFVRGRIATITAAKTGV